MGRSQAELLQYRHRLIAGCDLVYALQLFQFLTDRYIGLNIVMRFEKSPDRCLAQPEPLLDRIFQDFNGFRFSKCCIGFFCVFLRIHQVREHMVRIA